MSLNVINQFNLWCSSVDNLHQEALTLSQRSRQEAEGVESKLIDIQKQFIQIKKSNTEEFAALPQKMNVDDLTEFKKRVYSRLALVYDDLEQTQLTLLHKGRVNYPIETYIQNTPLIDRILTVACGHLQEPHEHKNEYCIDRNLDMKPDAPIGINSLSMSYLPDGSMSKIKLERLPTTIFNSGNATTIFKQFYRILGQVGEIRFNNMFGLDCTSDFGNPFNLVVPYAEMKSITGKKITDCPEIIQKYNQKLSAFFATVGFQFAADFNMKTMPNDYTIYKIG